MPSSPGGEPPLPPLPPVLYRDRLLLVLDKPAGVPVHAGPGGGATVEDWFPQLCFEHPRPPALAHRLDRDTAGCLLLGRSQKALSRLGKLFQQHKIRKEYWAVVRGIPPSDRGSITFPLLKQHSPTGWKMVIDRQQGQEAVTDWILRGSSADGCLSWLECRPQTGRTHQIRIHCQSLGLPLVGDIIYGIPGDRQPPGYVPPAGFGLHLLARSITVPLYPDREALQFQASVPLHMRQALLACGWDGA